MNLYYVKSAFVRNDKYVVAESFEEALKIFKEKEHWTASEVKLISEDVLIKEN